MKRLRLRVRKWWRLAGRVQLLRSLTAVWFLVRDARTPRLPKVLAWAVLAYALSPIDLIPDFIPVLGQLDDLLLLPLGVMLVVKLAPANLWQEMLVRAQAFEGRLPRMVAGLVMVVVLWLIGLGALLAWLFFTAWAAL